MKEIIIDGHYRLGLQYQVNPNSGCECDNLSITKRVVGANFQYWLQCRDCGRGIRAIKDFVAQACVKNGCKLQDWDTSIEGKRHEVYLSRCEEREKEQKYLKEEWFKSYSEYLKSPQWLKIRDKVLKRDGYLCQGCLVNKASHVHHMSYINLYDELAFQLVSLCPDCHNEVHKKEPLYE